MASKSKKRRRVFRASCILAALIIAGSSFAWFTSKDEVTNRLSASGDYDVSIVESFAPPAKWVPGQAVNKDVYAVNTGNVEAFVKESVSSVLTVVTEEAYDGTANKPDAESIELTPAERYVVEAGAFLAYAPLASEFTYDTGEVGVDPADVGKVRSGMKAVAMSPEPRQTEYDYEYTSVTDFQPDAEGLYVFRRTIGVDHDTQLEEYTYDAYYYVPGKGKTQKDVPVTANGIAIYRKAGETDVATNNASEQTTLTANGYALVSGETANNVPVYSREGSPDIATTGTVPDGYTAKTTPADVNGVDEHFYKVSNLAVTPEKATFAGDLDQRDGMVAATPAPTYGFYHDVTKTVVPTLTYDKENNRLVATYNTGMNPDRAASKAKLLDLADKYQDAAVAYEDAIKEYKDAVADKETDRAGLPATDGVLATESASLQTELGKLLEKERAMKAADAEYKKAKKEAEDLEAAMKAANTALSNANTAYGTSADVYNPDDGTGNTVWGRYNYAKNQLGTETAGAYDGSTTPATNDTAWGHELKAKADRDSKLADYNTAVANRNTADVTAKQAFLDLVIEKANSDPDIADITEGDRAAAEAYVNGLTYEQMVALNIVNAPADPDTAADPEYDYYTMVINEKFAKEELDKAEAEYEARTEAREAAEDALAIATKEKQDAEAALGDPNDLANAAANTAAGRAYAAQQAYYQKMEDLYGYANGGETTEDATANGAYDRTNLTDATKNHYVKDTSLYGKYKKAESEYNTQLDATNAQQIVYDAALAEVNEDKANIRAAADNLAKAKQAMDNAKAAYDAAYAADSGELKININLADVVTEGGTPDKWQILPESLEDVYNNTTTAKVQDGIKDTASFYYTSILGGGETSAKLIDSVELDGSVTQDMFKYFDFDLNITLNSAQVNIDENGNYTAETAQTELGKYALLSDNTSEDTAITWSDTSTVPESAKAKTYKGTFKDGSDTAIAADDTGLITELTSPKIFDYEDYKYVVTVDGNTYYGKSTAANSPFYKYDPATGTLLKANITGSTDPADDVYDNVIKLDASGAARTSYTRTVTFKNATTPAAADKTAEYVYTVDGGTWSGTAPAAAKQFCATEGGTYVTDVTTVLGAAPTADDTTTVYYKTE